MNISAEETRFLAQNITQVVRETLLVLDEDFRVVSASESFYRQFQLTVSQTENRPIFELRDHQWDISELRSMLHTVVSTRAAIQDFKIKHQFYNLGEKTMFLNARCLFMEHDKPALILLALEDVTGQTAQFQELIKSEQKYHKFVEELNSIIIGFDRQGNITFFNHFSEKIFGYNRKEVIGKSFIGTIIPCIDSQGTDNSHICRGIFANPENYYQNVSEGMRKDGKRIWFSWSANVVRDVADIITEVLVDGNDITELKNQRKEAEENSSILNALLNFIPEGIMITDSSNMIRRISRYVGELFEIPPERLLNTKVQHQFEVLNLHWPGKNKNYGLEELPLSRVINTGDTYTGLELTLHYNGRKKFLSLSVAPILDNQNAIIGTVSAWRDISENRQMIAEMADLAKFPEEDPNPVLRINSDGIILYVNKASKEVLTRQQCRINSHIPDSWNNRVREAISSGTHKTLDTRCGERVLSLNIVPIADQGYINIYASDITRRLKVEEELRLERERLRTILDNLNIGIIFMDKQGNLSTFNKAILNWYGYISDSEMWRHSSDYINEFDLLDADNNIIPLQRWPALRAVNGDYVKDLEIKLTRKSTGVWRWMSITTVPIYSSQGEVTNILMSLLDITESKLAGEALRQNEAMLNSIIDTLPVGIIIADAKGRITRINEASRKIWGSPPETQDWRQYGQWPGWWPDTGKRIKAEEWAMARSLNSGEEVRNELIMNRKFGTNEFRYFLNNSTPLRNTKGTIIGGLVAIMDITERLEAEKKLKEVLAQAEEGRNILSALMKNIPLGIAIADAPDVNIRMVSKYGLKILGRSAEKVTGIPASDHQSIWSIWHADGVTPGSTEELPLTRATLKGEFVENEEWFLKRSDGTLIPILCNAGPIRDDEGNIIGGVIGWSDITEQRKAREAMKRYAGELAAVNQDLESFSYSVSHDLRNPLSIISNFVAFLIEDYSAILDEQGREYLWRIDKSIEKMQQLINDILNLSRIGRQEIRLSDVNLSLIVGDYLAELRSTNPERETEFVIQQNLHARADPRLIHLAIENILRNAWKFTSKRKITRIEFGSTTINGNTVYFVRDNGAGFDPKFARKIFEPFQRVHAEKQFGGTGVGLSIVQKVIMRHGGKVWAEGETGKGATFYFTL